MRKKYIKIMIMILLLASLKQVCFGISDEFKFVINTIGVPRYNVIGDEINEKVYYTYNVFVYSSPSAMYGRTSTQRFKSVVNGKWAKDGVTGEYDILGVDYSGGFVYNVYFPVDSIPESLPDKWNYIEIDGALSSWSDKSKYKYKEQINYMKNSKLLFDSINYSTNTINPYNLVEYNITPSKIGLSKVRLNTAATWKTYGIVSINRINSNGQIRYATLAIKPIAASANIQSYIEAPSKVILDENNDEVELIIKFGSKATNLTEYAKVEHIKEISSSLSINGESVSLVKDGKKDCIEKSYKYKISREKFKDGTYTLTLKNNSYLYTEFYVDGLMQNDVEKNITIQINPKKVVPIEKVDVKVLEKEDSDLYVKDLLKTINLANSESIGIIEKEKHLALYLKSGEKEINCDNLKLYINNNNVDYTILENRDFSIIMDIKIPESIANTILSWNEYREKEGNYFSIDFSSIGERIEEPNQLKIEFYSNGEKNEKTIFFDTIDSYKYNMNYTFNNGVIDENINKIKVKEWLL